MTVVRVQKGHYGRTSGATGAYNPRLKISEADMNHRLAVELQMLTATDSTLDWQFVGPDEKRGKPCHMFIALHMDGSDNPSAKGPSIGYPVGSKESERFGAMWKQARLEIRGSNEFRDDNYTAALRNYYGWQWKYSGTSPVKLLIENGFVTNDQEATWAQIHRPDVAKAVVDTVRTYYGQPTEIDNPVDDLERLVERLAVQNAKQAGHIKGLQDRVSELERFQKRVRVAAE